MKELNLSSAINMPIVRVVVLGLLGGILGYALLKNKIFSKSNPLDINTYDPVWPDTPL